MPQIFQVLRCYKCLVFQVHQTKKSNKWECKLCGEKQSVKRHYGIGTAKDCRIHVQKLNCINGEIDELKCSKTEKDQVSDEETLTDDLDQKTEFSQIHKIQNSKWSVYVADSEAVEVDEESMHLNNAQVVLEIPKKRRKQTANNSKIKNCKENSSPLEKNQAGRNASFHSPIESIANNNCIDKTATVLPQNSAVEKESSEQIVAHKKFIPPVINKNSKWAQYAEDEQVNILSPSDDAVGTINNKPQNNNFFSLCDDAELDNILDL